MGEVAAGLRYEERRQERLREEEAQAWVSESRPAVQAELVGRATWRPSLR